MIWYKPYSYKMNDPIEYQYSIWSFLKFFGLIASTNLQWYVLEMLYIKRVVIGALQGKMH
jgi:hypothetical protein